MRGTEIPEGRITLESVFKGGHTLKEMVGEMEDNFLIDLISGRPADGVSNTCGIGDVPAYGVPAAMTVDGPAGLRLDDGTGIYTTAWPSAIKGGPALKLGIGFRDSSNKEFRLIVLRGYCNRRK